MMDKAHLFCGESDFLVREDARGYMVETDD